MFPTSLCYHVVQNVYFCARISRIERNRLCNLIIFGKSTKYFFNISTHFCKYFTHLLITLSSISAAAIFWIFINDWLKRFSEILGAISILRYHGIIIIYSLLWITIIYRNFRLKLSNITYMYCVLMLKT